MHTISERFRTRLLPALLLATGIALLGSGLLSYTSAVEPQPVAQALPSYIPPPTLVPGLDLPDGGGGGGGTEPSFPPDRVATRIVISKLRIDLPIIAQPPGSGDFPLCDVAMYLTDLGQPGSGRATYIYAHARTGMFYPMLVSSQDHNGAKMIGDVVQIYTSDNYLFLYEIFQVRRHATDLVDAFNDPDGNLWLQTSEGPNASYPKLQVVAKFLSADKTDPNAAHPNPKPRQCQ